MRVPRILSVAIVCLLLCASGAFSQGVQSKEQIERETPDRSAAQRISSVKRPQQGGTCALPAVIGSLPFNDTGDTTGLTNTVNTVGTGAGCGSITISSGLVGGPEVVYSFTVGAGNNLTFVLTPTSLDPTNFPYDPAIYVLSACGNGTTCVGGADVAGDNLPETLNVSGLAPGTYYFYVDSFYTVNVRRQGPYSLSVSGTLGVIPLTNTPTPTNTPTSTSTATSTATATNTPTGTITPSATATPTFTQTTTPVASSTATPSPTVTTGSGGGPAAGIPTLSGWMIALFAFALASVALFLTRRSG